MICLDIFTFVASLPVDDVDQVIVSVDFVKNRRGQVCQDFLYRVSSNSKLPSEKDSLTSKYVSNFGRWYYLMLLSVLCWRSFEGVYRLWATSALSGTGCCPHNVPLRRLLEEIRSTFISEWILCNICRKLCWCQGYKPKNCSFFTSQKWSHNL